MSDETLENVAARLSIADISTVVAYGLQRAIVARGDSFLDKILIYGGRLDFNIQVHPQGAAGVAKEITRI